MFRCEIVGFEDKTHDGQAGNPFIVQCVGILQLVQFGISTILDRQELDGQELDGQELDVTVPDDPLLEYHALA